jgi:hypothetical protein
LREIGIWPATTMALEFDLDNPALKQSLDETIVWCSRPQLAATSAEAADLKRSVRLVEEARELMREAYGEAQLFWDRLVRRDYRRMSKWQRGADLMAEATSSAASYVKQLRTAVLEPYLPLEEVRTRGQCEHIVHTLVMKRAELLSKIEVFQGNPDRSQGRLLIYCPEQNLADGAAEYNSCGFFDSNNSPPWDTWIAFSHGPLLSWVPALLLEVADKGIEANPEKCIEWLD